jgi:hypothetical protein
MYNGGNVESFPARSSSPATQADRELGITGRGGGMALNRPSLWRTSRQFSSWTIR